MLSINDLHSYQLTAKTKILKDKRVFLIKEMGLGKTTTTLTAIAEVKVKTLVIAPLRVAQSVWAQEATKWEHLSALSFSKVLGSEKARLDALKAPADVYLINRENVEWLVNLYGKKWPFKFVVIDESSSFKSPKSRRFKALKKVAPLCEYITLLTGTPSPNSLLDLWSQCFLIDGGQSLGKTFTGFKQRFFDPVGYMGYTLDPKKGAEEKIHDLMKPYTLSMSAKDYLDMPERVVIVKKVQLPPKTLKQYRAFENDLLINLEDSEIDAVNAAVLAGKLLQWCNGAVYDEDGQAVETHKEKLDALAEIVEDNAGESILVAYNFKSDLTRLKAKFPGAIVLDKDPETIEAWNRGHIKMLLAQPASAGHGLNLQKGGSLLVWFGLSWSLELYQQFNARLHRQGQTKPVRIVHIVAEGCIDERVMRVLDSKDLTQNKLIGALK